MREVPPSDLGRPRTNFLPGDRAPRERLDEEIRLVAESPLVRVLLEAQSGVLAVLNQERQVVAVNLRYLEMFGEKDVGNILGLRAGEALCCAHASDDPSGCGCSHACLSCGAAMALLSATHLGQTDERECALAIKRRDLSDERIFMARATPLPVEGEPFVLLTLHDITATRRSEQIDRIFFHDLSNLILALEGTACALETELGGTSTLAAEVQSISAHMLRELDMRRVLSSSSTSGMGPPNRLVDMRTLLASLHTLAAHHPAAAGRALDFSDDAASVTVVGDAVLIHHVLLNMLVNALEATGPGGTVRLTATHDGPVTHLSVWNAGAIPDAIAPRVFQRYFSTKDGHGRGLGTYAMKLFGEKYLGGKVSFTSSHEAGTWFRLTLRSGA